MSLVKWTDRRTLPAINSMLDNFFSDGDGFYNAISKGLKVPAVNVLETEESFELELAAPGKSKEDFKVEIDNKILSISSSESERMESDEKNYTRKEYSYNSFHRSFSLPENTSEEAIQANYENGLLKVIIPKSESSVPSLKTIPVG